MISPFAGFKSRCTIPRWCARVSSTRQVNALDDEITRAQTLLRQRIESFLIQVSDFLPARILRKHEAFRVLIRILNFCRTKCDLARLKWDTFLDYFLPESQLECHRNFLRVDDYYLKVLNLKEPREDLLKHHSLSEGDACRGLFIVGRGEIHIFKASDSGREQILSIEGPGS